MIYLFGQEVKSKICYYCGEELQPEDLESPHKDSDGEIICDDCYFDHFVDFY